MEGQPTIGVAENLSGTESLHDQIDSSAREGAMLGKFDLGIPLAKARTRLLDADLDVTIETMQGSIAVSDYLVTRCVEAVVHGCDLMDPVAPDCQAQLITSTALLDVLSASAPHLVAEANALSIQAWIDIATGRCSATGPLAAATPVMV